MFITHQAKPKKKTTTITTESTRKIQENSNVCLEQNNKINKTKNRIMRKHVYDVMT